jgi:hypothetical protein
VDMVDSSRSLYGLMATPAAAGSDGPPDTSMTASIETVDNDSSLVCLSLIGFNRNA